MNCESELHFLHDTVAACSGRSVGRDAMWQIAPVMASIAFTSTGVEDLEGFASAVARAFPELGLHGQRRAHKAFVDEAGSLTKPSYVGRLRKGDVWGMAQGQRSLLLDAFIREPLSGGLVFTVFHPRDLVDRKRPGYVPCLVAGSLVVHDHALHLNAFFRSQSIVEFGVHDLLFLRKFQVEFLENSLAVDGHEFPKRQRGAIVHPGPMNLHFGRVIIQSRLARNRKGFLRRESLLHDWTSLLLERIDEREAALPSSRRDPSVALG